MSLGVGCSRRRAIIGAPNIRQTEPSGGTVDSNGTSIIASNNFGFYSDQSGSVALLVRKGDALGGTTLTGLAASTIGGPVVNGSGQFATAVTTASTTVTGGIVSTGSGSLAFVASGGMVAPSTGGVFNGSSFTVQPSINALGETAFRTGITNSGTNTNITSTSNVGIFSESGGVGTLHLVAQAGGQVPGFTAGDAFGTSFSNNPGFNNAGQTAFIDNLVVNGALGTGDIVTTGSSGTNNNGQNNGGVFTEASGTIRTVAQRAAQAVGTPAGVVYTTFNNVIIDDGGQVAFTANLANASTGVGGVTSTTSSAVYSEGIGSTLTLIARTGNVAPGTPGDTFASFMSTLDLNVQGELLFGGTLTTGVGDVTGTANNTGLWAEDPSGAVDLLVRTGESFQVSPGNVLTVSAFSLNGLDPASGGEDGRPSIFNDSGVVPVLLTFTNGTTGVFTVGVPEPASAALAAAVAGLLAPRRRRTPA